MENKPKPRLFFTDPLKALWMMKEFGDSRDEAIKNYMKKFEVVK